MQVLITLRVLGFGFISPSNQRYITWIQQINCYLSRTLCHTMTAAKLGDFITSPSTRAGKEEIKQGLFRVGGFPCAIGSTDGTHLKGLCREICHAGKNVGPTSNKFTLSPWNRAKSFNSALLCTQFIRTYK